MRYGQKRVHALTRRSVLKLPVCTPVTDSGVICLHRSVTGIPEVGVVFNLAARARFGKWLIW
jgi:hypothetical protein